MFSFHSHFHVVVILFRDFATGNFYLQRRIKLQPVPHFVGIRVSKQQT
jgi:hypothetical protein